MPLTVFGDWSHSYSATCTVVTRHHCVPPSFLTCSSTSLTKSGSFYCGKWVFKITIFQITLVISWKSELCWRQGGLIAHCLLFIFYLVGCQSRLWLISLFALFWRSIVTTYFYGEWVDWLCRIAWTLFPSSSSGMTLISLILGLISHCLLMILIDHRGFSQSHTLISGFSSFYDLN